MQKSKLKYYKKKILNVIFWSVISAAFIGPGTITTATQAGASYGFDLLWALVFSTFACLLLQEASARVAIHSGLNLGQAIGHSFENKAGKTSILILIIGAIILGSAAYETGNILGSIEGIKLIFDVPQYVIVLSIGILAFVALSLRSVQTIAKFMGFIVVFMGITFVTTAIYINPPIGAILKGSLVPSFPDGYGAGLLVLGLVGTTVVPYDLFLGSGVLDKKQTVSEMRFGISVAIILGGLISMAILVVGTIVEGEFSYAALAEALSDKIEPWIVYVFGFGMFAAGFSSSITAPLASSITAKSLFEKKGSNKWKTQGFYYKAVWGGVLATGLFFGFIEVKPIPAIILAQALNGLILPFISIFLIFVINDETLMGKNGINGWFSNVFMTIIVWVTLILGFTSIVNALSKALNISNYTKFISIEIVGALSLVISLTILVKVFQLRKKNGESSNLQKQIK